MTIEEMRPDDWPACARIYEEGLDVGTFEDEVPSWESWHASHTPGLRIVAEVYDELVGCAALARVSTRRCYRGVAENSVYVARGWRSKGVGRVLLDELVRRSEEAGIWTIQASIFPENRASLVLHERCGFRVVGTRERIAKRDGIWRDTVLLERRSEAVR